MSSFSFSDRVRRARVAFQKDVDTSDLVEAIGAITKLSTDGSASEELRRRCHLIAHLLSEVKRHCDTFAQALERGDDQQADDSYLSIRSELGRHVECVQQELIRALDMVDLKTAHQMILEGVAETINGVKSALFGEGGEPGPLGDENGNGNDMGDEMANSRAISALAKALAFRLRHADSNEKQKLDPDVLAVLHSILSTWLGRDI
jgi:hypothetical protein